jgi:predicted dehydrogenase
MHCAVTIRALEAEKHVLTEARMAMNLAEARMMFEASKRKPHLVAQVVPSPFGLCADGVIRELLDKNVLGPLREVVVLSTDGSFADPHVPIHWRKLSEFSGKNMLELGILHEMLGRWIPEPTRVFAQTQIFTPSRSHSGTDQPIKVETPDCVHVLADLPNGARAVYRCCDSVRFGPTRQIRFYGSKGSLKCLFDPEDRLFVGQSGETEMTEVTVNSDDHRGWRVEAEFIGAIRGEVKVRFADFASGVRYMEFTEAVAQSAASGQAVDLPLA